MDNQENTKFYENFWKDFDYVLKYNFDSAVRDRFPAIQKVWGEMFRPSKILDFGCGNGVLTYWMHCNQFAEEIIGVDISQTGITNASSTFKLNGLKYKHLGTSEEEVYSQKYDAVISSHVLEHIPSPEAALKKIRHLADWYVIEVPLEKCLWFDFSTKIRGKDKSDNDVGHVNFWTKRSFQKFLEENGMLIVRDYHYASAPYSPFNSKTKRLIERLALSILGLNIYSHLMSTHYVVLARKR